MKLRMVSADLKVRATLGLFLVTLLLSNALTSLLLFKRPLLPLVSMLLTSNSTLVVSFLSAPLTSTTVFYLLVTTLLINLGRSRTPGVLTSVNTVTSNSLLRLLVTKLLTLAVFALELMLLTFEKSFKNI